MNILSSANFLTKKKKKHIMHADSVFCVGSCYKRPTCLCWFWVESTTWYSFSLMSSFADCFRSIHATSLQVNMCELGSLTPPMFLAVTYVKMHLVLNFFLGKIINFDVLLYNSLNFHHSGWNLHVAFFYCEIDGSSLCLQCDMIVHVGGKRTHERYLLLRQRVEVCATLQESFRIQTF